MPDDFEERARAILGKSSPQQLDQLLKLRAESQSILSQKRTEAVRPSAEELNARNQQVLDEAAKILGAEKFKELFGHSPDERINLVDPSMLQQTK